MQVNGEAQNLTPHHAETPYAGVIKIGRGDHVVDHYTCAKVRHDTKPRDRISPVLAQLHWLPVNQRITYKLCLLMHLVHIKHCPDYLNNLVHLTADSATRPGLRSATRLSYRKPALASKFSKRAFSYAGPAAWNSLPDHIQSITNTASFKRQLKTFFSVFCMLLLLNCVMSPGLWCR